MRICDLNTGRIRLTRAAKDLREQWAETKDFWSDNNSDSLGDELDFVLIKPINKHLDVLTKGALFDGTSKGPANRWRYWLEFTFKY